MSRTTYKKQTKKPVKKPNSRSTAKRTKKPTKTQMHLHHKLAWVLSIGAALTLGIASLPNLISAWGPTDRKTFTEEVPASYVAFNSITNHKTYGDERNFVLVKDNANTSVGGWSDVVKVEDDHTYLVRVLVHNNAAANLNLVAENVRMAAAITAGLTKDAEVEVKLTSSNANPQEVWDEVNLKADTQFQVAYIDGSGRYYTNANLAGYKLGNEIVTSKEGALLGYDSLNGKIPGCYQYSGIATFKIKVNFVGSPSFTVDKTVRVEGQDDKTYHESVNAKPGDTVKYKIAYINNGEITQQGVGVKDTLPNGLAYDSGSTVIQNTNNPNGVAAGSDAIISNGIDIGDYLPVTGEGYSARVYFTAKIPENAKCGTVYTNWGIVKTTNGSKEDSADVNIECEPPADQQYCQPGIPEGDPRCTDKPNECKPGIPVGDARCNDPEPSCEETGTCVTEITRTGAGLTIFLVVIVAAAVVYHHYYVAHNKLKKPAHSRKK